MPDSSAAASNRLMYSVGIGLGVTMLSGLSYIYYKYMKRDVMPTKWRRVGTLDRINLFPVKSCAPLQLSADQSVECDVLGLRLDNLRDRALMLIDDDNQMVTARAYPTMVLIKTHIISETKLRLSAPNMPDLELDFTTLIDETPRQDVHTTVWGTPVDVMLCGAHYDEWFSQAVLKKDKGLRLVYYPYPLPVKPINQHKRDEPHMTQADTGALNDATSYMLMNLSSVNELNSRLDRPVEPLQFRGNFDLKMDIDQPYAEDDWGWVKIGNNVVFRVVAPCTRCILPNINPFNGTRDVDGQPLKELNKYRKFKKYPSGALGIHLGIRQAGSVMVDDVIYVEDK